MSHCMWDVLIFKYKGLFNSDVDIENYAVSTKYLNHSLRSISIQLFPYTICHTEQGNIIKIPAINVKHEIFKNSFFPSAIIEWNKLDVKSKNSESIKTLKKKILSFIRPSRNSTFNCHNPKGIKLLSRLRLGLSHLREHKFKYKFKPILQLWKR